MGNRSAPSGGDIEICLTGPVLPDMVPPFLLVLFLIVVPVVVSANAPVFVHPRPNKVKRHKAIRRRTFLA